MADHAGDQAHEDLGRTVNSTNTSTRRFSRVTLPRLSSIAAPKLVGERQHRPLHGGLGPGAAEPLLAA
jgi:hypothetical protein